VARSATSGSCESHDQGHACHSCAHGEVTRTTPRATAGSFREIYAPSATCDFGGKREEQPPADRSGEAQFEIAPRNFVRNVQAAGGASNEIG
jgi:hypothetical protein